MPRHTEPQKNLLHIALQFSNIPYLQCSASDMGFDIPQAVSPRDFDNAGCIIGHGNNGVLACGGHKNQGSALQTRCLYWEPGKEDCLTMILDRM